MKKRKGFSIHAPLSAEEWQEIKRYRQVPAAKKLEMLDRYRSLMFQVWKENPAVYRAFMKFRRGEI